MSHCRALPWVDTTFAHLLTSASPAPSLLQVKFYDTYEGNFAQLTQQIPQRKKYAMDEVLGHAILAITGASSLPTFTPHHFVCPLHRSVPRPCAMVCTPLPCPKTRRLV